MPLEFPLIHQASSIKFESVLSAMENKGYKIYNNGDYSLNVVGVRRTKMKLDTFNDVLLAFYPLQGQWMYSKYQITTIPGATYLSGKPLNAKGTALLVPGQYFEKYTIRKHDGDYDAFCQKKEEGNEVKAWRDNNMDGNLNPDKSKTHDAWGINIHRANPDGCTISVQSYSAGCQVFRCAAQFKSFMDIVRVAKKKYGNSFTYTLLDQADL
jgi:hypothetical protein